MLLETGMIWGKSGLIEKQSDFIQADLGPKTFSIGSTQADSLIPLPVLTPYMTFNSDRSKQDFILVGRGRST